MSWLKKAFTVDEKWLNELRDHMVEIQDGLKMDNLGKADTHLQDAFTLVDTALDVKEATILDFPSYDRDDLNKGENGEFDENAPADKKKKIAPDPGPASLNPGQPGAASPQIFQ